MGFTLIQPSRLAYAVPQRKIFNVVADGLTCILQNGGVRFMLHYLDNFLVACLPASEECDQALRATFQIREELGIPIAEKVEDPRTCLTFLGIEINTERWQLRLPGKKLQRVRTLVASWRRKKGCTKQELLFLIGVLLQ